MFQRLWRWRRERRSGSFCARRLGLEEETKRCPLLPSPSCIWASWAFSLGLNMGHFRTRRTAPSCGEDNNLLPLPPRLQALAPPRHRPHLLPLQGFSFITLWRFFPQLDGVDGWEIPSCCCRPAPAPDAAPGACVGPSRRLTGHLISPRSRALGVC
jgi:hypothetical protein